MKPASLTNGVSHPTVHGALVGGTGGLGIDILKASGVRRQNSAAVDAVMIELAIRTACSVARDVDTNRNGDTDVHGTQGDFDSREDVLPTETDDSWHPRTVDGEITGEFSRAPTPGTGHEWGEFDWSPESLIRIEDGLIEADGGDGTVQGDNFGHRTPNTSAPLVTVDYGDMVVADESTESPDYPLTIPSMSVTGTTA